MNVRNCRKCGNLFNYVSGPPICMACREKLEEKFQEVKKYIQDNGHAGIQQVERLELSAESGVTLSCENCGAAILSGRFCGKCKNSMANELGASIKKPEPIKVQKKKDTKENPKMRFLN